MRTYLFTADQDVIQTVRAVAPDAIVNTPSLSGAVSDDSQYICDDDSHDLAIDAVLDSAPKSLLLLLVSSTRVDSVRQYNPNRVHVLVKPVHVATLRSALNLLTIATELDGQRRYASALDSDRRTLIEYILKSQERSQERDRARNSFLSHALQDLRTPVSALLGYCGLLAESRLGSLSAPLDELVGRMQTSTRRLFQQVKVMLELTDASGALTFPKVLCADIDEIVAQVISDGSPMLLDKDQTAMADLETPASAIFCDSQQIVHLLLTLLENCSKASPPGSAVEIVGLNIICEFDAEASARLARPSESGANGYRIDVRSSADADSSDVDKFFATGCQRIESGLPFAGCTMIATAHRGFVQTDILPTSVTFSLVLPFRPAAVHWSDVELDRSLLNVC